MRKVSKFKSYLKSNETFNQISLKIVKFKHSKWARLKKKFQQILKKPFFFDPSTINSRLKTWDRLKNDYKTKLKIRRGLIQNYDQKFNFSFLKKDILKEKKHNFIQIYKKIFVKLEYKVDFLIVKLQLFDNIYEVQSFINSNQILVNNHPINCNYILKKGDVITINTVFSSKKIISKYVNIFNMHPFVEFDSFLGTIVIVKDIIELTNNDLSILLSKNKNLIKTYRAMF